MISTTRRKRLLLGDSHRLFAEACKGLLEPEFEVAANVQMGGHWYKQPLN